MSSQPNQTLSGAWTKVLFEAIDDAVFVHDLEGRILEANPAACRRLGYTRAEMLQLRTRDIDAGEFAGGYAERLRQQLALGRLQCEGRHRTKDGRIIPVDINTSTIQLDGQLAVLAVMRDISQRIEAEEHRARVEQALRDSEAVYHSLVESLPQNIFRKDLAGRLTFTNERYCAALKRSPEELLGKTDFDLFPAELAANYVRDDQRVLESGATLETVEEHSLPDGTRLYVQVVKTPIFDDQGRITGTQGIFWDVTERQRAAELLANSERRYRQLTESTLDGIVLTDDQQRILLFNPAAERMFGYPAGEILGQPVELLIPGEYRPLHHRGFGRFLETRQPRVIGRTLEMLGQRKDGSEFPVEIALSVVSAGTDANDAPALQFLAAFRDLTERNRMRAVLVQNEKLASIGLLSAGVAHEINNPLAFVANNLAVLQRDFQGYQQLLELYESVRDHLGAPAQEVKGRIDALAEDIDLPYLRANLPRLIERTRAGVERVTRIVHSLRGLARTDAPRRQEVNVPDLVEATLEILQGRFKRSGIVVAQDHDANPRIACVSTQIHQVLLNLLMNAFQAVEAQRKEGGRVTVRTRRLSEEFLIEVSDNGCGIDPELLPKLFDPFFTTKDVGDGTGLGLSITHNIITAHGGRIQVDPRPGQGACFQVYLPLRE